MRKRKSDQPRRRGAPTKPRPYYRRLFREWSVFLRNNPSLSHEQAARKFLRVRPHWANGDLALVIGGYGRLRNASALGEKEDARIRSHRQRWHLATIDLSGMRRLVASPLQEAQAAYLLAGIGSDSSLASGG